MKKILFVLLFLTQLFYAQNGFEKGNNLYQRGKYEEAITNYESVLKSKKQSAELYFNLGNCYYKLNKVAHAIYNFEKALLLNPNDKDFSNNLKFAQKLQIDDIKEVPKVGFNKVIRDFTASNHYNTWAWIAVFFASMLLVFFMLYYFSQTTLLKRIFFVGMIFTFLGIVLSVSAAFFEKTNYDNDKPAILFAEIIAVKTEPNSNATTAFMLHEGTKVYVFEIVDNFKKIELSDGKKGWIEANVVKELK